MKISAKNKSVRLSMLLILILVGLILFKFFKTKDLLESGYVFNGEINSFCINDFCIEKEGENWVVTDGQETSPAKQEAVELYLEKFKAINKYELVSDNPDKLNNYGMNGDILLTVNGKTIEIGEVGGSFDQTYIREKNSNQIYTADVLIDKSLIREKEFWQSNR